MVGPATPKSRKPIGKTLVLNLAAIGLATVLALSLVLSAIIQKSFSGLEDDQVSAQQARLEAFKTNSLVEIEARSKDWAIWDDTYLFLEDFNQTYIRGNVNADSFDNALIDALLVLRYSDSQFRSYAFARETGEPLPALAGELARVTTTPEFRKDIAGSDDFQGFVNLQGRIYSLGAINIRRSDGSGKPPGYLVFLSEIDNARARAVLQADVTIVPGTRPAGPALEKSQSSIAITAPFLDSKGRPVGYLDMTLPRPLMSAATELSLLAIGGVIFVIIALLLVMQRRVRALVLAPIETFHAHLQEARASGDLKFVETPGRDDELGAMQEEYNRLVGELQNLRAQLESQSFALGTSQSAIGLMHNLRNCLSPVRVILELLEQQVNRPLPPQTARALAELQSPDLDPQRRAKLVEFLNAAHDELAARKASNQHSVREAARNLMTAFAAIDNAQDAKGTVRFDEKCELGRMLSQSSNIARFAEGCIITSEVEADQSAIAKGNRVLLSQVLENLVMNAVESIQEADNRDGAISLKAVTDPQAGKCLITVTDNGGGFDPADAPKLFERGFSTREGKSGGLGLHWCANTINAMGGELVLESKGPGRGATAQLSLDAWRDNSTTDQIAA